MANRGAVITFEQAPMSMVWWCPPICVTRFTHLFRSQCRLVSALLMSNQLLASQTPMATLPKALALNLDDNSYGTIAEIGAGQEVARCFFRAGGAAGTIAKSMSAYDMKVSDSIYGEGMRYVSRDRLHKMLSHEYTLLVDRLASHRSPQTQFFSFADTVAARSYKTKGDGHGWMGISMQM